MTEPLVSVVLPVYNCEEYLGDAIESILGQTYDAFEFIIINDGSNDGSADVIAGFQDERLRVFHQVNQGLAATLNRGISLATGSLIARQDQDDLSYPERLAKQVAYMQAHPNCVLLGTWAQILELDQPVDRFHRHPVDEAELRYLMLFNNPFVHSSVMLRKEAVQQVGDYTTDPERQPPEDFELWSRLSRVGQVANIGEVLLAYREIPGSMSRVGPAPFRRRLITLCAENIAIAAGLPRDDHSARAIAALIHGDPSVLIQPPDFERMEDVLLMAIQSLAAGDSQTPFRKDAISRIHALQAGWIIRESPAYDLLHRPGPIRSVAKRLWHLVKRLRGPQ